MSKKIVKQSRSIFVDRLCFCFYEEYAFLALKSRISATMVIVEKRVLYQVLNQYYLPNDELKNICQVEHSRHRSFGNFLSDMIAGLIAYSFLPKKHQIKFQTQNTNQICLF